MPKRDCFQLRFSAPRMIAGSDEVEVMLYGEIVPDFGKYYKENYPNDKSAADFDKAIKEAKETGAKRLLLRINSPGGIVSQAVAMRSILTGANFDKITIRVEGLCASAATIIASIPGAHVVITPGSEYMIHNPWTWGVGNANEMERVVEHLRNLEKTSREFYNAKTGQDDDQIKKWMDAETWFTAKDAVKYGFADELAKEQSEGDAAACVSSAEMEVMRNLYKAVPSQITVKEAPTMQSGGPVSVHLPKGESGQELIIPPDQAEKMKAAFAAAAKKCVSNGTPVAGAPTEIKNNEEETHNMDINELTAEQLQAQNPALYSQVQQNAVAAERERLADIDALTLPGYEAMAAEAKANGTSAMDFQKQIVKAQREKGSAFLANRQTETKPAQAVAGSAAGNGKNETEEIEAFANDVAEYAKSYSGNGDGSMF